MTKCTQNPIDADRLHRHDFNAPGRQPTHEGLEVQGSGVEIPNDCARWALRSSDRSVTSSSLVFDKCHSKVYEEFILSVFSRIQNARDRASCMRCGAVMSAGAPRMRSSRTGGIPRSECPLITVSKNRE